MKADVIVLSVASMLAFAHPDAAQVALAAASILAASRIEYRRKQHNRKALQQKQA